MIIDLFQKSSPKSNDKIDCLFDAAESVLGLLTGKVSVSPKALQEIMTRAFGGSDASGAWQWKDAYEVLEIEPPPINRSTFRVSLDMIWTLFTEVFYGKEAIYDGADYRVFAAGRSDDEPGPEDRRSVA